MRKLLEKLIIESEFKRTETENALKKRNDIHNLTMKLSAAEQRSDEEEVRKLRKELEALKGLNEKVARKNFR